MVALYNFNKNEWTKIGTELNVVDVHTHALH